MLSASRHRLRTLSGEETKEFDLTYDIVDLNIPDVEGFADQNTIKTVSLYRRYSLKDRTYELTRYTRM
jgi:hypothetical protein